MTRSPIVFLGQDAPLSRAVVHALRRELGDVLVIFEEPVPRKDLLRRRVKNLGIATVAGQVLFAKLLSPVLRKRGADRIDEIRRTHGLDEGPVDSAVVRVPSVNSDEARAAIAAAEPEVVVVTGTRIIGKTTLASTPAPFLNVHAGITPLYRGVNGAYFAVMEGRPELVGTTIHFIDEGIDTGTIIHQETFGLTPRDSWATYPYLHIGAGIPPLIKAVRRGLQGTLTGAPERADLDSRLRYPPTLWGYLYHRVRHGAR